MKLSSIQKKVERIYKIQERIQLYGSSTSEVAQAQLVGVCSYVKRGVNSFQGLNGTTIWKEASGQTEMPMGEQCKQRFSGFGLEEYEPKRLQLQDGIEGNGDLWAFEVGSAREFVSYLKELQSLSVSEQFKKLRHSFNWRLSNQHSLYDRIVDQFPKCYTRLVLEYLINPYDRMSEAFYM